MITRAATVAVLIVGLAAVAAIPALAQQTFMLTRPAGELGVGLDAIRSTVPNSFDTGHRTFREWIRLRMSGAVLDPRLLRFSFDVSPSFTQSVHLRGADANAGTGRGFAGSASMSVLSSSLVSLALSGSKLDADATSQLGSYSETNATRLRALLRHNNRYLPMELSFDHEDRQHVFQGGPTLTVFRSDRLIRTGRFRATNRRLRVWLDQISFLDRVSGLSYLRTNGSLLHRLNWGKGSRLTSQLIGRRRSGTTPFRTLTWRESLVLQHTQTVSSALSFSHSDQSLPGGRAGETIGSAELTFRVLSGLSVNASGYTRRRDQRFGRQSYSRVGPGVNLTASLPLGILLRTKGKVGYEWHENDPSLEGSIDVVDEPHVVSPSGRFRLDRAFADPTSIVISSEDGTEVFQEDFDYRAVVAGPFVEIVSLPGGRMTPGTSVRVDYRHTLTAEALSNAWVANLDVALLIGRAARLYYNRSLQTATDDVIPGTLPGLRNYDHMTAGLSLHAGMPIGEFGVTGEYSSIDTDTFDFEAVRFLGSWRLFLATGVYGFVSGGYRTQWQEGALTLTLTEARGGVDLRLAENLRLDGHLVYWKWRDPQRMENFLGGKLQARWTPGLVTVDAVLERMTWEALDFPRTEDRVFVRLSRRF